MLSQRIQERLNALNLTLPTPPPPAAAYLPYQWSGSQLWIAGQIPMVNGTLLHTGKVGDEISLEEAQNCARACVLNILAQLNHALQSRGGSFDQLKQVVKLNVFVAGHPTFDQQHLVANGASLLIHDLLGQEGIHARSAVGVASLPLNCPVEIDAIIECQF